MTEIKGNTYPVRGTIKSMGFIWNKRSKSWERTLPLTPDEENRLNEIRGIIVQVFRGNGENYSYIDTRSYKQRFGRCEDAPCCGCCGPQFY